MTKSATNFPYKFLLPLQNHSESIEWCTDHFGKRWSVVDNREGTWCVFWRGKNKPVMYEWYFQNEQDAVLFLLKWA